MKQTVSQILGLAVTLICLLSPHFKRKWQMLICTVTANILSGIGFLLIGEISATGVCAVAVLQAVFGIRHSLRGTRMGIAEILAFSALFVAGGLLPYLVAGTLSEFRPLNALPIFGALLLMCSIAQTKEQRMRLFGLANGITFTVYDAILKSTHIFAQIIGIISCLTALLHYRKRREEPTEKEVLTTHE